MWTSFMDMHSGGRLKEAPYQYIYIEASEQDAVVIFYNRFGHSPHRVTCTCCGEDYSVNEGSSVEQLSACNRGCAYDKNNTCWIEEPSKERYAKKYQTFAEYRKCEDVLIISKEEVKPSERIGTVPQQGYVWQD